MYAKLRDPAVQDSDRIVIDDILIDNNEIITDIGPLSISPANSIINMNNGSFSIDSSNASVIDINLTKRLMYKLNGTELFDIRNNQWTMRASDGIPAAWFYYNASTGASLYINDKNGGNVHQLDPDAAHHHCVLDMHSHTINQLANGIIDSDAVNLGQLNSGLSSKLNVSGGAMTGSIDMNNNKLFIDSINVYVCKQFTLTSTFNAIGDSWTAGDGLSANTSWCHQLATLASKTVNNMGVSGKTIEYHVKINVYTLVTDSDYAARNSILFYGINEINKNNSLTQTYLYMYHKIWLAGILCACLPQSRINLLRTAGTRTETGIWANSQAYATWGRYTSVNGATLMVSQSNVRYVAISFSCTNITDLTDSWDVSYSPDNVTYTPLSRVHMYYYTGLEGDNFNSHGYIFDIGQELSTAYIKVTHIGTDGNAQYVDWMGGYSVNDTFRKVLCIAPPTWLFSQYPNATYAEHQMVISSIANAVDTCKLYGLPVYHLALRNSSYMWQPEAIPNSLHVTLQSHINIANEIYSNIG